MHRISYGLLVMTVCLLAVAQTQAAAIPVGSAEVSSYYNAAWSGPGANVIDGNLATQWQSHGNSQNEGKDDAPYIKFFFDDVYNVDTVTVWNLFGSADVRGVRHVDILVSTDGVNFTYVDSIEVARGAADLASSVGQEFDLGGVAAKVVMFDIKTNWAGKVFGQGESYDGLWANGSIVGLVEVAFTQIPEPATMSLLALGGLALRRRKR